LCSITLHTGQFCPGALPSNLPFQNTLCE
jgi:hypothetical protein